MKDSGLWCWINSCEIYETDTMSMRFVYIIYFSIFHLKNKHNSIKKVNKYTIPGLEYDGTGSFTKKDYAILLIYHLI